jgi:hypothetical protein
MHELRARIVVVPCDARPCSDCACAAHCIGAGESAPELEIDLNQ